MNHCAYSKVCPKCFLSIIGIPKLQLLVVFFFFFKVINYHLKGGTVCVNTLKKFLLCCGLGLLVFPKPLTCLKVSLCGNSDK